jgi:hypothetical protein
MLKKPESVDYNRPVPDDEKRNIVLNLYESRIGEEFIALQLDLEIPTVISTEPFANYILQSLELNIRLRKQNLNIDPTNEKTIVETLMKEIC